MNGIKYAPDFLTRGEHDDLFAACDQIPFSITKTQYGKDVIHSSMTYGPEGYKMRSGYNGDFSSLKDAPDAVKMLQQKLSKYADKTIDYLSVVRYRDGNDGMVWHQHSEDRHGQDASVWIVRTGTERMLSTRPIIGYKRDKKGKEVPIGGPITHMLMTKGSLAVLPSSFNDKQPYLGHLHAVLKYKGAELCYSINCKVLPTNMG